MKKKVQVTISQKPNFNIWAFKYVLLALNPNLKKIEFQFADNNHDNYIFDEECLVFKDKEKHPTNCCIQIQ